MRDTLTDREPLTELVGRVDLCALVERYSGPGRVNGARTLFRCPHPSHPDTHPSFDVHRDTDGVQRGRCRSACMWSGDALDLVKWLEDLDTAEAISWLRDYTGTAEPTRRERAPRSKTPAPPKAPPPLPTSDRLPEEKAAQVMADYLAHRGWPSRVVERFGLEVVLDRHRSPRIRHPFHVPTPSGPVVVSWQDRAHPTGGRAKWLAPEGRPLPLWNLHTLTDTTEAVVLTEGPADGITAALALEDRPEVAVLGVPGVNGWRKGWSAMFAGLPVLIAADNDTAGTRLRDTLTADLGPVVAALYELRLREANDLGELWRAGGGQALRALLLAGIGEPTSPPEPSPVAEPASEARCVVCSSTTTSGRYCSGCAGLPWRACSRCGEWAVRPDGAGCILTPGCDGTMSREAVS